MNNTTTSCRNWFSVFIEEESNNRQPPHGRHAGTIISTRRQEAHSPCREARRGSLAKVEDMPLSKHGRGTTQICIPLEEVVVGANATTRVERFGRQAKPILDSGAGRHTCVEEDLRVLLKPNVSRHWCF